MCMIAGDSVVKNLPANAGGTEGMGLISGWEDLLEKEMTTHFSIHAWKIPWTEEPGGESMGLQRASHGLATEHACTCMVQQKI